MGCGSSDSLTPSDLHAQVEDSLCEMFTRCGSYESQASCLASLEGLQASPTQNQLVSDVAKGFVTFNASADAACLAAIASASCDSDVLSAHTPPAACTAGTTIGALQRGTIADGANCFEDSECKSGSCDGAEGDPGACTPGTCDPTLAIVEAGSTGCGTTTTRSYQRLRCRYSSRS